MGLKFNCNAKKSDKLTFIARTDAGIDKIRGIAEENKQVLKQRVAAAIKSVKEMPNITMEENKIIKALKLIKPLL